MTYVVFYIYITFSCALTSVCVRVGGYFNFFNICLRIYLTNFHRSIINIKIKIIFITSTYDAQHQSSNSHVNL